jgi:hypothetical protein
LVRGEPSAGIRSGYRQVAFLAHGWYLRCHRGIEAVLLLDLAGQAEEASPIRRSVIEHGVALRWLAVEGDRILDTIARGHARNTKKRGDAVAAANWTSVDPAQFKDVIANIDPESWNAENDYLLHFTERVTKYADEHTIPGYLAEVARTHAGYESAASYVDLDSGSFLMQPRDPIWQVPFATTQLLEALLAVREVFDPQPWETELEGIIRRYESVTNDVRVQDGLQPIDWSTGKPVVQEPKRSCSEPASSPGPGA